MELLSVRHLSCTLKQEQTTLPALSNRSFSGEPAKCGADLLAGVIGSG